MKNSLFFVILIKLVVRLPHGKNRVVVGPVLFYEALFFKKCILIYIIYFKIFIYVDNAFFRLYRIMVLLEIPVRASTWV